MKKGVLIGLVLMILVAGCGGLSGDQPSVENTDTNTESSSDTQSNSSTSTNTQSETQDTTQFTPDSPIESFLISESELPDHYALDNERTLNESTVTDGTKDQFDQYNMQLLKDKSFFKLESEADGSRVIVSTVVIFDSNPDAEEYKNVFIDETTGITSQTTVNLADSRSAQQIQFENQNGLQNVVYITRINNMVLYTTSSDPESYHPEQTRSLFIYSHSKAYQEMI